MKNEILFKIDVFIDKNLEIDYYIYNLNERDPNGTPKEAMSIDVASFVLYRRKLRNKNHSEHSKNKSQYSNLGT